MKDEVIVYTINSCVGEFFFFFVWNKTWRYMLPMPLKCITYIEVCFIWV